MTQGFVELVDGRLMLTDFRMAGFLVSRGFPLLGTDINHSREVLFIFDSAASDMLTHYPESTEHRYDTACKAMHEQVRITLGRSLMSPVKRLHRYAPR